MEKLIKIIKEQTGDSKDLIIKEYNISNKKCILCSLKLYVIQIQLMSLR